MLCQARSNLQAYIAGRTYIERNLSLSQERDQLRILQAANAVSDAHGRESADRAPYTLRSLGFPGMRKTRQAGRANPLEDGLKNLGRVPDLGAAQAEPNDAIRHVF